MPLSRHVYSAGSQPLLVRMLIVLLVAALAACGRAKAPAPAAAAQNQAAQDQHAQDQPAIVQPGAPGAPTRALPASTHASLPARSPADTAFMQGMIMHHTQAVEMTALIPTHTENKQVRALGARISSSQGDEMRLMQRWLAARGEQTSMPMGAGMGLMPGMLTPAQMEALREARGPRFDRLFLQGMIQHHQGALDMVDTLFQSAGAGQDADLFNFATDADNTQRAEIRIMQSFLEAKQ